MKTLPNQNGNAVKPIKHPRRRSKAHHTARWRRYSDIEMRKLEWIWPGLIPRGALTMLAGRPGFGKSTMLAMMAASVSLGRAFPGANEGPPVHGKVLMLTPEDGPGHSIKPKLYAHGAEMHNIVDVLTCSSSSHHRIKPLRLPRDVRILNKIIKEVGNVQMLIIDPLSAFIPRGCENSDVGAREATAPLLHLAEKHNIAVVFIKHLRKDLKGSLLNQVSGSVGFGGLARSVLLCAEDPRDPTQRLLVVAKSNVAAEGVMIRYHIETAQIAEHGQTTKVVLANQPDPSTWDQIDRLERASPVELACAWLRRRLAGGPVLAETVLKEAKAEGISERTLQRAKVIAGVTSNQVGRVWKWSLSGQGSVAP